MGKAQGSILELVTAFEQQSLSRAEFEQALEQHAQSSQKRQEELANARILPEDQALWNQELRPGLEACYEGLQGAVAEALEYARTRDQDLLPGIVGLLEEVDKIAAYVEGRTGLVSAATAQAVQQGLGSHGDGLAIQGPGSHGKAESQVSFIEE